MQQWTDNRSATTARWLKVKHDYTTIESHIHTFKLLTWVIPIRQAVISGNVPCSSSSSVSETPSSSSSSWLITGTASISSSCSFLGIFLKLFLFSLSCIVHWLSVRPVWSTARQRSDTTWHFSCCYGKRQMRRRKSQEVSNCTRSTDLWEGFLSAQCLYVCDISAVMQVSNDQISTVGVIGIIPSVLFCCWWWIAIIYILF